MSHAEVCPVCGGEGMLPNVTADGACAWYSLCHGCNGRGWVDVGVPSEKSLLPVWLESAPIASVGNDWGQKTFTASHGFRDDL